MQFPSQFSMNLLLFVQKASYFGHDVTLDIYFERSRHLVEKNEHLIRAIFKTSEKQEKVKRAFWDLQGK